MRRPLASALELIGFAAVGFGLWRLSPWVLLTVSGVVLVYLGNRLDGGAQ